MRRSATTASTRSPSSSSLFAEYEYLHGTVLLRLSHYLTPSEAVGYERALKENQ